MRLADHLPRLLVFLCMVFLAAVTVYIFRAMLSRPQPPLATVDITAIVRQHHAKLAADVAHAESDMERQRQRQQTAAYGPALERAIAALRRECGCILILREAIVAGAIPDLTPRLVALVDTQ